jgi:uncharacterized protein YrrD
LGIPPLAVVFIWEESMASRKEYKNKPLISITDGKHIGEVKDLYLDGQLRQIGAVYVRSEGLISRKNFVVRREDVKVFGEDVWLVAHADVVVDLKELPNAGDLIKIGDVDGRELVTEGGTKVATVSDVLLNPDGSVLGFTLGKVYAQGPVFERKAIHRDAVLNVGDDKIPMKVDLPKAEMLAVGQDA